MEKESFNYTISSDDRTNVFITDGPIQYDVDFGGFSSHYQDYNVEVVNCILSGNVDTTVGYLVLVAENLNDNGVFCRKVLSGNQAVMCTISTNEDVMMSNGGVSFRANNLHMQKRVTFKFLLPDMTVAYDDININITAETKWLLTLRLTPIIN